MKIATFTKLKERVPVDGPEAVASRAPMRTWLLRIGSTVLPTALIACLYGVVAYHWWSVVAGDFRAAVRGEETSLHALGVAQGLSTALFYSILAAITFTRKQPMYRERRLKGWLLPIVVMVLMGVVGSGTPGNLHVSIALFATALVIGGTAFTLYSLRFLGRHFGVVSDVRGLVMHGPYAWVRHPLYAGEAITLAGVAIAVGTPLAIGAFLCGLVLQLWRARTEEESLATVFPEYETYAARTPMLIPGAHLFRAGKAASAAGGD